MDQSAISSDAHFHILWGGFECLDWQCFNSREAATTRAKELARPDEAFTIVEVYRRCPQGGPKAGSAYAVKSKP